MPPVLHFMKKKTLATAAAFMILAFSLPSTTLGDGPSDNLPSQVRPIPPPGIEVPQAAREQLADKAAQIRSAVGAASQADAASRAEVLVFARALELALEQGTFYSQADVTQATALAERALRRAKTLQAANSSAGMPNWLRDELEGDPDGKPSESTAGPRLIVGGFRSQIDGSIQPYGLVVPAAFKPGDSQPLRLDVWLHGRGEKVGELQFLSQRSKQVGEVAPAQTIVLHPFGRYCNAFKFAGEIDVLEAIEHVKTLFPVDENRINIRGFSMGGAGCWQMAVHYPSMWMAATPGAGFAETREFLKGFQQEEFIPTDYQEPLLHWYDCPDWANNLRHLPTIAYSGELDRQKQAADVMERALRTRGIELTHLIGPQTAHKLHPDSKAEIERRLAELARQGRNSHPREVDFTTYTLRYHRSDWVDVQGLEQHWKESRAQAKIEAPGTIRVSTGNVSLLTLGPFEGLSPDPRGSLVIDQQELSIPSSVDREAATITLSKHAGSWTIVDAEAFGDSLRKRPGLQGPIDDAFLSPFVFVSPAEVPSPSAVDRWVSAEFQHATDQWRRHFRGDVNVKSASALSPEDKRTKNLVLFGTPASNPLIAEALQSMPIAWTSTLIRGQGKPHSASTSALVAIYPSPFATDRYVVINSGFTYRQYAYLNNARQIPMLPDWAIVNVSEGATTQLPGKIVEADFFDESWGLKPAK